MQFRNPSLQLSIEQSLRRREREVMNGELESLPVIRFLIPDPQCEEPNCNQRQHARGKCRKHYDKERRAIA